LDSSEAEVAILPAKPPPLVRKLSLRISHLLIHKNVEYIYVKRELQNEK